MYFTEETCIIEGKHGKFIATSTRIRASVFQLNPTKMTCLVAKVDGIWLRYKRFCHINFDNIVKVSITFVVRDLHKIVKPTNVV